MSVYISLLSEGTLGGLMAIGGCIFKETFELLDLKKDDESMQLKKEHMPIMVYHGLNDTLVAYELSNRNFSELKARGFKLMESYSEEGLEHSVSCRTCEQMK